MPTRARLFAARTGLCLLLAFAAGSVQGCELVGFITQAFNPPLKKVYKLKEVPTVVIVDDPNQLMGNRDTSNLMAVYVGYEITKNIEDVAIIPQEKVQELREEKGKDFEKMSLSSIGKTLEAKQVISVHVEEAELNMDASVWRPRVITRIKVIDVDTNSRAFPPLDMPSADDPQLVNRGFAVNTTMFYQAKSDTNRSEETVTMQALAKRAGADISKLFYDHKPEEPGERFKTVN